MIPPWLTAGAGGNLRRATIGTCRGCSTPVLRGLDADTAAILAEVDLGPIDEIGEVLALLQGRATFDLLPAKTGHELEYRDEWRIRDKKRFPIMAQHRCGNPLPTVLTPAQVQPATLETSNECPF